MRLVIEKDRNGYLRAAWVRDTDPDSEAHRGIPMQPPDLERIDWEGVKRDLHNALVESRIFNFSDLQRAQNAIFGVAARVLRRRIVELYKLDEQEVEAYDE